MRAFRVVGQAAFLVFLVGCQEALPVDRQDVFEPRYLGWDWWFELGRAQRTTEMRA